MANKKNKHPPKTNTPVKKVYTSAAEKSIKISGKKSYVNLVTAIFIAICGMLLYANTANHDFVLDDFSVIAENKITTGGIDSIPRILHSGYREGNYTAEDNLYRPLTKIMFAIEYDISGGKIFFKNKDGKPFLLHFINIILYGFLCGFIFLSLRKFFPGQYYLALITTLLFTFHPIHTEVVANIKSRDEIVTLFFLIASLRCGKQYADTNKFQWVAGAGAFYMLALLTKESAITYVALLPVSLWFFSKFNWQKVGIITLCMLLVTGLYLYIHTSVVGEIGLKNIPIPDNSIVASKDFMVQRMTAIEIMGRYLRLLIFPHPLSSDYSFDTIPLVKSAANVGFLISLLIHLGGLVYAIRGLKKKSVASYAILFYLITISIVSNLVMLIGTNMAERLIFIPSLGFCLLVAFFIVKLLKAEKLVPANFSEIFSKKAAVWLILVPLMVLASIKIYNRNKDWKNVSTLFNADIKTVPNSVHMLLYHAGMITNTDSLELKTPDQKLLTLQIAERELLKADSLYEPFPNSHSLLGVIYKGMAKIYVANKQYYIEKQQNDLANQQGTIAVDYYNKAILHFRRTLSLNNIDPTTYNNCATCFFELGQYDSAGVYFKKAIDITPICYADALANLGSVYGMAGAANQAQGKNEDAKKFFYMAIDMFNKTLECDKDNMQAYQFLGVTYTNLGDTAKARPYTDKYNILLKQKQVRLNNLKK